VSGKTIAINLTGNRLPSDECHFLKVIFYQQNFL